MIYFFENVFDLCEQRKEVDYARTRKKERERNEFVRLLDCSFFSSSFITSNTTGMVEILLRNSISFLFFDHIVIVVFNRRTIEEKENDN